jgi:hypothetical protein
MRLDRFALINVLVEGFSGDDVATPDSDCFQFALGAKEGTCEATAA